MSYPISSSARPAPPAASSRSAPGRCRAGARRGGGSSSSGTPPAPVSAQATRPLLPPCSANLDLLRGRLEDGRLETLDALLHGVHRGDLHAREANLQVAEVPVGALPLGLQPAEPLVRLLRFGLEAAQLRLDTLQHRDHAV